MKLITLNIWGGHIETPLLNFIKDYRDVDVFCFQEVYHNAITKISTEDRTVSLSILAKLQEVLPEHRAFFCPVVDGIYGIAMFVKKNVEVVQDGELLIHDNPHYPGRGPTHLRKLQWIECRAQGRQYAILNVHGLWNGMGKTDTAERIAQSQRIREHLDTIDIPQILCGDFNLRPDTESIKIIEHGMDNLITSFGVCSTRTSLYEKEEKFADYIFTSPDVSVNKFEVLQDEVSDHAPLLLDFY